jgi:hypothetical protein
MLEIRGIGCQDPRLQVDRAGVPPCGTLALLLAGFVRATRRSELVATRRSELVALDFEHVNEYPPRGGPRHHRPQLQDEPEGHRARAGRPLGRPQLGPVRVLAVHLVRSASDLGARSGLSTSAEARSCPPSRHGCPLAQAVAGAAQRRSPRRLPPSDVGAVYESPSSAAHLLGPARSQQLERAPRRDAGSGHGATARSLAGSTSPRAAAQGPAARRACRSVAGGSQLLPSSGRHHGPTLPRQRQPRPETPRSGLRARTISLALTARSRFSSPSTRHSPFRLHYRTHFRLWFQCSAQVKPWGNEADSVECMHKHRYARRR